VCASRFLCVSIYVHACAIMYVWVCVCVLKCVWLSACVDLSSQLWCFEVEEQCCKAITPTHIRWVPSDGNSVRE
jgi:hypothetical protein